MSKDTSTDPGRPAPRRQTRKDAVPFTRPPLDDSEPATANQMYALSAAFVLGSTLAAGLAFVYTGLGCPSDVSRLRSEEALG